MRYSLTVLFIIMMLYGTMVPAFSLSFTDEEADIYIKQQQQVIDNIIAVRESKYGKKTWTTADPRDPNYMKYIAYTKLIADKQKRLDIFSKKDFIKEDFTIVLMETISISKDQMYRVSEKVFLEMDSLWGDVASLNIMGILKGVMSKTLETIAENWVLEEIDPELRKTSNAEFELLWKDIYKEFLETGITPTLYVDTARDGFSQKKKEVLYTCYKVTEKITLDNSRDVLEIYQKIQTSKAILVKDNMGRVLKNQTGYSRWAGYFAKYFEAILSVVDFTDILYQNMKLYTNEIAARGKLHFLKKLLLGSPEIKNYQQALDYYNKYGTKLVYNVPAATEKERISLGFFAADPGDILKIGYCLFPDPDKDFYEDSFFMLVPSHLPKPKKKYDTMPPETTKWFDTSGYVWDKIGMFSVGNKPKNGKFDFIIPETAKPGEYQIRLYYSPGEGAGSIYQTATITVLPPPLKK